MEGAERNEGRGEEGEGGGGRGSEGALGMWIVQRTCVALRHPC